MCKYYQYIENDRITDLKKFNKNGKFLIFEIPNGGIKKYLILQRTKDQKLKAYYWSTLKNLSATKNCNKNRILDIHIDPKLFIAGLVEKIIPSDFPEHYKTNEHNRIDMRIQNCNVIYYHRYYARIIDRLLK